LTFIRLDENNSLEVYFKHNTPAGKNDPSIFLLKKLEDEPFKVWGVDANKLHEGQVHGWY
jgi:hypothetical protein